MGRIQDLFSPSLLRTAEIVHHHRKGVIYGDGIKYILCTVPPTRRTPRGNRQLEQYHPENADVELRAGRTDTRQFSPYQFQLSSHVTIFTDDHDNDCHASAAKGIVTDNNQINKYQKKVLLLDMREKIY